VFWGPYTKNYLLKLMSWSISPVVDNIFIVHGLSMKSLIYFVLFIGKVRDRSIVSFLRMWISTFPSTVFWRDYPFPFMYCWHLCKNQLASIWVFMSRLPIVFLWSPCVGQYCPFLIIITLCYIYFKSGSIIPLYTFFFAQDCFGHSRFLWFHTNFRIFFYLGK
jgi:hypothetical protein